MTQSSLVPTRVLILGGTSEATDLGNALAGRADIEANISLAGRTAMPISHPLPTRIGGFGGVDGLIAYLKSESVDILVDATHPFATQISQNAVAAAQTVGCLLLVVSRPAWVAEPEDRWMEVENMAAAANALGGASRRVFLTIGSLQLSAFAAAPHHFYLVRTINPVAPDHGLPRAHFIEARGPFDVQSEIRLMQEHRIDVLVTKNSGGAAAAAKIEAARSLGLSVILVRRPEPGTRHVGVSAALAAIDAHQAPTRRGV